MSRGLQKMVWIVLLAGVLPAQGSFYDNVNDMNDNDYSSDDDDSIKDKKYLVVDKPEIKSEIVTKPQNFMVYEGEDVKMPCEIYNPESYTILWKNGSEATLYLDYAKISTDKRILKFANNSLMIKGATIYDSTEYQCQLVTPKIQSITHHLVVVRNLTFLYIEPDGEPGKPTIVNKGDILTFFCNVTGFPIPNVHWERLGQHKHFPNGRQIMEGATIELGRVTRLYTGSYKCIAKNKYQSVSGVREVLVRYPPEIEIEQETMTAELGQKAHILCKIHGEPLPTVEWYKNNKYIEDKLKYNFSNVEHRFFLQINRIREGDYGNYKCVATNVMGVEEKTIILSGSPTKPIFKSAEGHQDKSVPEINWYVESYSPIIEYEFQYKKIKDGNWTILKPIIIQSFEANIYTAKVILLGLPPGQYKIRVRARNHHGWSFYSEEKKFLGDLQSRGGPPTIKPIVTVLPFIVAICVCYM